MGQSLPVATSPTAISCNLAPAGENLRTRNLSADKVREPLENEPGVLVLGERSPRHKRRYVTLRIPHSVLEGVHLRLSSSSASGRRVR